MDSEHHNSKCWFVLSLCSKAILVEFSYESMFTSIASVFVIRIAKNITKLKDVTIVTIFVFVLAPE